MENRESKTSTQANKYREKPDYFGNIGSDKLNARAGINYDYDWNTDYGDGDIPDIDKPQ